MDSPPMPHNLAEIAERIERLARKIDALKRENAELRARLAERQERPNHPDPRASNMPLEQGDEPIDRT
jgi:hypothetical protein